MSPCHYDRTFVLYLSLATTVERLSYIFIHGLPIICILYIVNYIFYILLSCASLALGCPTASLISGHRATFKYKSVGPSSLANYIVRLGCPRGFLLAKRYNLVENQCVIPSGGRIGTWRKPSIGCKKVKCERPPDIRNGNFTPYLDDNDFYKYGGRIQYTCDSGYEMTQGSDIRTCNGVHQEGFVFIGQEAVCSRKDCRQPPLVGHSTTVGSGTLYEAKYTVACATGYNISGPSTFVCQADGTWSKHPTCNIVECEVLPQVANAKHRVQASEQVQGRPQAYGSRWRFTCHTGFRMLGETTMTCQADGTWTPAPVCIAERCAIAGLPAPTTDEYACIDCAGNSNNRINATRTYRCREGYRNRESKVICQRSGLWTSLPTCSQVVCGVPGLVTNGQWDYNSSAYGDTATLRCNSGFQVDNRHKVLTCSSLGQWKDGPTCIPVDCGAPPTFPYLVIRNKPQTTGFRTQIRYKCVTGYNLVGSVSHVECLQSGQWSTLPSCQIKNCGFPATAITANGTYTEFSTTVYGTKISYQCNYGFMFQSASAMICQVDGQWSKLPRCVAVDCKPPVNISSASLVSYTGNSLGDTVTYMCMSHHDVPTVTATGTCGDNGKWSYPDCLNAKHDAKIYIYIGCAIGILLVIVFIVLLVGLFFRRSERKRRSRMVPLTDKSPRRGEGSHCSNDSGLSVDGEHGESDNPPSLNSYDYKTATTSLLMKSRPQGSPPGPYSTNSLTKPRSRQPIELLGNDLCLEMMSVGEDEDIRNPLYGEQRCDRRGSKNSSPCNFRTSPCNFTSSPAASIGMASPLLNNLNSRTLDNNRTRQPTAPPSSHGRQQNIVDSGPYSSMDRYTSNPKHLQVIPGQELSTKYTTLPLRPTPPKVAYL